jgi:16S rRNA (cytosine1402-N4)-methyltransferase
LTLSDNAVVVDATIGLGGHAARLLERIGERGRLIGLDVDDANLEIARQPLAPWADRVTLCQRNFRELRAVLDELHVPGAHVVVADLGVSSNQLDDPQRGLSFATDGPLDMRLDPRLERSAVDFVNATSEKELADLFWNYSQERFGRRIAKRICQRRKEARIRRTTELARIVAAALDVDPKSRKSKIHPATRVFQALRMAVNDEIANLEALLKQLPSCLLPPGDDPDAAPGGQVAIISFHSVEDGLVKRDFRQRASAGVYQIRTKKPITPGPDEIRRNPRARSAKLRVAQRVE